MVILHLKVQRKGSQGVGGGRSLEVLAFYGTQHMKYHHTKLH